MMVAVVEDVNVEMEFRKLLKGLDAAMGDLLTLHTQGDYVKTDSAMDILLDVRTRIDQARVRFTPVEE